ncbi:MAG: F0F1 ATP synthase subunit delta [Pseudomonadota bacterium]
MASSGSLTSGIAERYAAAFFDLAQEHKALDDAEKDLAALKTTIAGAPDLLSFIKSPVYSHEDQEKAIAALADKADFAPLTANFLKLIARNQRLFALPNIIKAFEQALARHRGEVSAEATTAVALSDEQARRLRQEIETLVGQAVNLQTNVDASLLGGMVVKVGSKMIDSSLKTKLNRLQSVMKEA